MIDNHSFNSSIDLDSPDHQIAPGFIRTARNIIWRGFQGKQRAESVVGTTKQTNPFLPGAGVNKCIGSFYDPVNQQLYDFNFNSLGTHGIYVFNTLQKTWLRLIEVGINTSGDPLGFTASGTIQGIDIIYGDGKSGNLLFFVDSLGRPTKINVTRFLNTPYATVIRPYLNVIKAPPVTPPQVTYENDTTVNANNLINSLFQFAQTFIYDDNEESVLGPASIIPLPTQPFSNTQNIPVSEDSRIAVYLQTGDQNVKSIRLYMRQTQNGTTSGWFIVDTIQKFNVNAIPNNFVYRYVFYNGGNYIPADPAFTALNFDLVPQQANCQALLSGTTISYGGITEGYPYVQSLFSENLVALHNADSTDRINGHLFFATFNGVFTAGQPQVQIFVTGAGANNAQNLPITLENSAANYYVKADSSGTDISFQVTGNTSVIIATILSELETAAISAGWTFVSSNNNSITIYYPTGTTNLYGTFTFGATPFIPSFYRQALFPSSNYAYGIVYRDANGRTNGTITDISANIVTIPYGFGGGDVVFTDVQVNLNAIIPPPWAVTYSIVRTNTLTYNKFLVWISNQAFSNASALVVNQYAYISITNIADYNTSIQATQGVVGYQFSPGDRIRFLGVYLLNGNLTIFNNNDYAILGTEVNPIVNGTIQTGTFIKIAYPSADISPNFKFDGDPNYQSYKFIVYNVSANNAPQTANTGSTQQSGNVFWEVGYSFGIGNQGTNLAYHFGNWGRNQIRIQDGDIFYRPRTVPAGNTYFINVSSFNFGNRYATPLIQMSPLITPAYTLGAQNNLSADPNNYGAYPQFGDGGGLFLNTSGVTQQVRLRGTVEVTADHPTWMDIYAKIDNGGGGGTTIILLKKSGPISTINNTAVDITFDGTFGVPANAKMWLIFGNGDSAVNLHCQAFQMRLDVVKNITIQVFDFSFSDIYNIRTNADNRASVQDTNAATTYFSTLFRYSRPYQLGTNINNTNRFYPNNFDEFDKAYGDLQRMVAMQREVIIFQKRRCGQIGIYSKFIKDNTGVNNLIVSDTIITPNNIQYFAGEYGIGNQVRSVSSSGFQHYFADPVKGYMCRLSLDGIVPISELYHVQTFVGGTVTNYLNNFNYAFGGNSQVLSAYNFTRDRASEVIFVLQGGTSAGGNLTGQSLAFKEEGNAWTSFYDFAPDSIICCENTLYSFSNGVLYSHDNQTTYCNFYGTQFTPTITVVKNDNINVKKSWRSISEVSNVIWSSPLIYTDAMTYPGQRQESILPDDGKSWKFLESQFHASFYRDSHSRGGIGSGDGLKGNLMVMQLQPTNTSKLAYISEASVKYEVSPVLVT